MAFLVEYFDNDEQLEMFLRKLAAFEEEWDDTLPCFVPVRQDEEPSLRQPPMLSLHQNGKNYMSLDAASCRYQSALFRATKSIGFFDDTPQGPQGEYRPPRPDGGLRVDGSKGRQMRARDGQCRFADPKFRRIFEGEALAGMTAPGGRRRKKKKPEKIEGVLMPPGAPKHHSTPGDWYGCLGPQPESFSPETKPESPRQDKVAPNFSTSPNPKGGPGYLKICINPYLPRYAGWEPYEEEVERKKRVDKMQRDFVTTCRPLKFFNENPYHPLNLASRSATHSRKSKSKSTSKLPALPAVPTRPVHRFYLSFPRAPNGPYSGCFARFPRYLIDPYHDRPPALHAKSKSDRPWRPTGRPVVRTKFTESVVEKVTRIACNSSNFADYREQVYTLY